MPPPFTVQQNTAKNWSTPALVDVGPRTYNGDLDSVPAALSDLDQWLVWRWVGHKGKFTKPPFQARSPERHARSNDPATWSAHAVAVKAVEVGKADGIGFVLTGTELAAIDLDKCRDPLTGAVDAWAQAIVGLAEDVRAYVEVTVSGTGLRVIGIGTGPEIHTNFKVNGGAKIELYRRTTRYITVSGLQIGSCKGFPSIDALIDSLVSQFGTEKPAVSSQGKLGFEKRGINDIIKNGVPERQRSEAFQSVVWRLANTGLSVDDIEQALAEYPNGIAQKYLGRLRPEIERSYSKWRAAGGITSNADQYAGETSAPPQGGTGSTVDSHNWDDPDLSILDDRRGDLPEFPLDVLTEKWRNWVEPAARGAGVTPAHVAVPLIAIASSLIGTARRAKASRSFSQPMTTWAAIVGFSGTGKTPGIDATKRVLAFIERTRKAKIAEMARNHETRAESASAARKKWKKEVEAGTADGRPAPPMPASAADPGAFVAPRLYVSDATIERMAVLLTANPRGILRLSDELASLFLNMRRYSGGQDNEFWLEAWNGNPYVVERMSRPPVSVDYLLVGVVGGLQPDKVAKSFEEGHDGMYTRICFSWPPESEYQPLTDDVAEVEPDVINGLLRLVDLPCGEDTFAPKTIPLSASARARFEQLRQFVHATKAGLDGREREWLAKVPAHVLRLSGTLCLLDWSMIVGAPEPEQIDDHFMSAAVRMVCDYFWPHSRAALRQIGFSERHANSRRVLRWIKATRSREVSIKDIRRDALAQSLDAEQTEALVDGLVASGWLRPKQVQPSGPRGGKPVRRWQVNPLLWTGAETAETAETLVAQPPCK
jgi:hypothetical protein